MRLHTAQRNSDYSHELGIPDCLAPSSNNANKKLVIHPPPPHFTNNNHYTLRHHTSNAVSVVTVDASSRPRAFLSDIAAGITAEFKYTSQRRIKPKFKIINKDGGYFS